MKTGLLLPLLFIYALSVQAQQWVVRGQVLDKGSDEPVAFANVYLEGAPRGTYTSAEGYFEFRYRQSDRSSALIISHIGYESLKIKLADLAREHTLYLHLQPKEAELQELVITPHKDTVRLIVEKAARSIRKNYARKGYTMKGFYREANRQGAEYVRLVESAVTVQDKGYDANVYTLRARVDEVRKSSDKIDLDWKSAINNWYYEKNGIYQTLKQDPLRKKDISANLFENVGGFYKVNYNDLLSKEIVKGEGDFVFIQSPDFLQGYDFYLDTVLLYEGKPAYKILFVNEQAGDTKLTYGKGALIIQQDNYAILDYSAQLIRSQTNEKTNWNMFVQMDDSSMVLSEYRFIYRPYKGRYYLSYASVKSVGNNSSAFSRNWEASENAVLYQYNELLVTDILKEKIKQRELMAPDEDIYETSTEYRQEFWDSYNVLLDLPIEKQIKQDLEKKKKPVKQSTNSN